MEPSRRRPQWHSELRVAGISMVVGAVISLLFGIGRANDSLLPYLLTGAVVGFTIYLCNTLLAHLLEPLLSRLTKRTRLFGDIALYLVGGLSGWLLGFLVSSLLFGSRVSLARIIRGPLLTFLVITAVVSVTIGLLFRTFEALTERLRIREWAERELDLARTLQTRLLPPADLVADAYEVVARNLAAHTVAGDFYDIIQLEDRSLFIAVADVAGKGVGASMIMASVKSALPYVARDGVAFAAVALNRKLSAELGPREFVAMASARYEPASGRVELVNAGCPDAYVIRKEGVEVLSNPGTRLPLGIRTDVTYEPVTVILAPGDRLLLLTDGIPEAPVKREPLGYDALLAILDRRRGNHEPGTIWLDELLDDVRAIVDEGLDDDWTALVLERTR